MDRLINLDFLKGEYRSISLSLEFALYIQLENTCILILQFFSAHHSAYDLLTKMWFLVLSFLNCSDQISSDLLTNLLVHLLDLE